VPRKAAAEMNSLPIAEGFHSSCIVCGVTGGQAAARGLHTRVSAPMTTTGIVSAAATTGTLTSAPRHR
jgi:hypothetical protein